MLLTCRVGNTDSILNTYHYNDKVKPTPSIGEVFDKTKGEPFDTHFKEKDHSKNSVHVV